MELDEMLKEIRSGEFKERYNRDLKNTHLLFKKFVDAFEESNVDMNEFVAVHSVAQILVAFMHGMNLKNSEVVDLLERFKASCLLYLEAFQDKEKSDE